MPHLSPQSSSTARLTGGSLLERAPSVSGANTHLCVRGGFWSNGRDGHKEVRRENDVNFKDQSRCGDRGGKRQAAEPAAELGIKAIVYTINEELTTN